nr:anillin [Aedes albopictus]
MEEGTSGGRVAPLGSIDSDDEIESLQKYQDRGLDDLLTTLRENITLSEIGTIDTESDAFVTGYDTVDFIGKSGNQLNSTIDTDNISELMSAQEYSGSNLSPVNSSPSSADKMRLNGSDIYRSLKDRLRSSFRKSKRFIKNEHRKIANLFDEKSNVKREEGNKVAFNLSDYQRKYESEVDAEEVYQSLSNAGSLAELSSQFLAELVNQIKTQCDLRKQLKQALAVCRNTREFECSSELIEAERLMLLSTLKETAARNELSKIDYNGINGKVSLDSKKIGLVALNHFEFPLKETAMNDMLFNYFYLIVCSYKNQVKATLAKERYEDRVYFRNCEIKFHDLEADYRIRVEVYVLRLRKNARNYSFESKYHLNKDNKNLLDSLPSPAKLRNPAKLLTPRSSSPKNFDFDNEFSRFKSQGYITLTASHLLPSSGHHHQHQVANEQLLDSCHQSPYYSASSNFQQMVRKQGDHNIYLVEDFKYLQLDSTVYNSNLLGGIGMSFKSEVLFANSDISGFLTVGDIRNERIDWGRKWCKVNGFVLEFWNYPQECQEKLPTLQIDLTKCIGEEVKLAERAICSRPRTLQVEVIAKGINSCSSSGISSYKDSDSHNQNSDQQPSSSQGQSQQQPPHSPSQSQQSEHTRNYLLSVDTPNELKMWLNELNRVVKFLKEWKI